MKRNVLWRGLLILAILVISVAFAYPLDKKINLGLDLRGGMHLVLQVHTEDALRAETDGDLGILLQEAKDDGLTLAGSRLSDTSFEITGLTTPEARDKVDALYGKYLESGWSSDISADRARFTMKTPFADQTRRNAVTQAKQTIDNRINAFGVAETVSQEASNYRLVVELPGVDDQQRVRNLIKNTAFLEFRIVRVGPFPTRQAALANFNNQLPADGEMMAQDVRDKIDPSRVTETVYWVVEKQRTVTGRDLKDARVSQGGQFGEPVVAFNLNPEGAEKFSNLTGSNIGKPLAIILDGRLMSAPRINARIRDSGIIEGGFTPESAKDLALVLRSGALPASISYLEERTVGPSLGRDSIEKGILAGVVGTALVVLYMLIIYNLSGLNAVVALALNVVLLFGGLAAFNAALTLPGIAGVILTIGMAVDANVLVFERIREELRAGRTIRSSIDLGFEKALSSIVDGNLTTLIAAAFLFQFGTGPIKGFAVTLTIGLLASMFTAVFVSRWLFDVVLNRYRIQKLSI
jgi:preprotein translocase subunit SecD